MVLPAAKVIKYGVWPARTSEPQADGTTFVNKKRASICGANQYTIDIGFYSTVSQRTATKLITIFHRKVKEC